MRKNTLIKLLAVLAMCFLIGAALVSCGEGETEETAKTIVGVEFVGDKLVITYDDGSNAYTAIPEAPVCEHKGANSYPLVNHGIRNENDPDFAEKGRFTNGVILTVCNDCHEAWTTEDVMHVGYSTVTTPATCLDPAYVASVCEVPGCGEHFDKQPVEGSVANNHNYAVTFDPNPCVGGDKIETCTVCNDVKTTPVEPAEGSNPTGIDGIHNVTAWDFTTNAPTLTEAGFATGTCATCGEQVENYPLPAIKNEDGTYNEAYSVTLNERESCSHELTATVTLKADATITYAEVVIEAAGGSHMLMSTVTNKLETVFAAKLDENGKPLYTYSVKEFTGIKGFADKPVQSCTPILAYYYCDVCDATVDVYAYSEHVYGETPYDVDPADCLNDGTEYYKCTVCASDIDTDIKKVKINALGHKKEYSELINISDPAAAYNKFQYTATCTRTECVCDYEEDIVIDATNATITSQTVTCVADGWVKVAYTIPAYKDDAAQPKEKTFVIEKLGHYLNGQHIQAAKDNTLDAPVTNAAEAEDNDVVYKWEEGCGIKAFDGKPFSADKPVIGYFECDNVDAEGHKHYVDVWVQIGVGEAIVPVTPAE